MAEKTARERRLEAQVRQLRAENKEIRAQLSELWASVAAHLEARAEEERLKRDPFGNWKRCA